MLCNDVSLRNLIPSDRDVLAHYGVVADPARVRDPNFKGTVENAIQHTQSTALKVLCLKTIEEQSVHLEQWVTKWAAPRIHGIAKRQIEAMFQEERAHFDALPLQGFGYYCECERTVADDTCIRIDHSSTRRGRRRSGAACWCACSIATSRFATVSRWLCYARSRAPSAAAACCCPTTSGPSTRHARRAASWPSLNVS